MHLSGRRVLVVGLGHSGLAAARLCAQRGAKVTALDSKKDVEASVRALEAAGITLALGSNDAANPSEFDLVVVSPGVPSFPGLEAADAKGVPILSEIELAVRCLKTPAPVVAIGGTNGKSTTTTLVGELLSEGARNVFVGGNLGVPLASHVDETFDVVVLEVSSFQMERVDELKPKSAALLNVTEDHLDRYPDFAAYAAAKGNCFQRQDSSDLAVVPFGDETCLAQARRGKGRVVTFGTASGADVAITADAIIDHLTGQRFARSEIAVQGGHNALNVAAALALIAPFGITEAHRRAFLSSFLGLGHRMALVAEIAGVRFYDDSKGTNVGAVVTALEGVVEPKAVLIAGGKDKGGSYEPLVLALERKGRAAVLIGEAAPLIERAIAGKIPVERATTMADAVKRAQKLALVGDAVLLSPACSSFDMFRDYKHRGDEFVRAVKSLEGAT
ncbi:UDP-N-acetylmuramoyl-L-alanine--D-glutamate ligase [soil metagenome]